MSDNWFPVKACYQHCDYDNDNEETGNRVDNQNAMPSERNAGGRHHTHRNRSRSWSLAKAVDISHTRWE
jgi:hypothetical protein